MDDCPVCGKAVLDHGCADALRCAHTRQREVRVLVRHALTASEETVDASTWTRAADVRSALEFVDQAILFTEQALPELKSDDD